MLVVRLVRAGHRRFSQDFSNPIIAAIVLDVTLCGPGCDDRCSTTIFRIEKWKMHNIALRHSGRHIIIHTDGACIGNPGPGGWAAVLQSMDGPKELKGMHLKGSSPNTTNNRMEMTAPIEALKVIKSGNPILIRSDSQLLVKGMNEWLANWKLNGWRNAQKKPVLNRDLWEELEDLAAAHSVTWEWVRGHSGDPLNEKVDRLANEAARSARQN